MAPGQFNGQHVHGKTEFCKFPIPKQRNTNNIITDQHVHSPRGSYIRNLTGETQSFRTIAGILNNSRAAREAPNRDHFDVIMNNRRLQVVHSGPPTGIGGGGNRGGGNRGRGGRAGGRPPPPRRRIDDDDDGGCCIVM